jgi:hypothetical protein
MTSKVQTIKFKDFMDGSYKQTSEKVKYSFVPISPMAFIDPNIVTFGAIILAIALAEKHAEKIGMYDIAEKVAGIVKFALTIGAFGYLMYFITGL